MIKVNEYNYNSNICKNFKSNISSQETVSQKTNDKDKTENLSEKTKIMLTLAATAAFSMGVYYITRGKGQNPTDFNSKITSFNQQHNPLPKTDKMLPNMHPQKTKTKNIEKLLPLKRPDVKRDIKFPKGYKDYLTPMEREVVDYAADEFSRTDKDYFLNELYVETPFGKSCYNIFYEILQAKYKNLRYAHYDEAICGNPEIAKFTSASTSSTKVGISDGWHYRLSTSFNAFRNKPNIPQEAIDRFSLNVTADENLIKSLDDYFESGKVKGYYKTPDSFQGWVSRHDPITIYLHEPVTKEIEQDIIKIANPYIRSSENVLAGEIIIPGIAKEESPTREKMQQLVNKALEIDEKLAKAILKDFGGSVRKLDIGNARASAGQFTAAQELVDFMTSLKEKYPSQTA